MFTPQIWLIDPTFGGHFQMHENLSADVYWIFFYPRLLVINFYTWEFFLIRITSEKSILGRLMLKKRVIKQGDEETGIQKIVHMRKRGGFYWLCGKVMKCVCKFVDLWVWLNLYCRSFLHMTIKQGMLCQETYAKLDSDVPLRISIGPSREKEQ